MDNELECYRCGASLGGLTLPFRRLEQCPDCEIELHVCRMCAHYAPARPKQCHEEDAEEVRDKTAANFCDFYQPAKGRLDPSLQSAQVRANAELDALFGTPGPAEAEPGAEPKADDAITDAEALFKKG